MSLRRIFAALCALVISSSGLTVRADTEAWKPLASQSSLFSAAGVKKDDSQMTVVGNDLDRNIPIVDVATNSKLKKKPAPSFWSRLVHPSQWFSKSKK